MIASRFYNRAHKNMLITALITAVSLLGDAMLYAVLPIYSKEFGLNALWQIGILLSINRFVRIPIHPLIGWFYTRYRIRSGLLIAVCLTVVSTSSYGIFNGFFMLLFARCIWGVAWAFIKQAGQLLVVEAITETKEPGRLTGLFNGISGSGGVVGMVIGSLLSEIFSASAVLIGFSILSVMTFPLVFLIQTDRQGSIQMHNTKMKVPIQVIWDQRLIILLSTGFVSSLLFQGYMKSTLSYWVDMRDLSASALLSSISAATLTGILLAIKWGAEPFLGYFAGKLSDKSQSRTEWLTVSTMLGGILFVIIAFHIHTFLWIATLIGLLLLSSIVTTLIDADAAQYASDSSNKHYVVSVYSMTIDIGAALGPFLGFTLLSIMGNTALNIIAALLLGLCGFMLYRVNKRNRDHNLAVPIKPS